MTYTEKLKMEHPDSVIDFGPSGHQRGMLCPSKYGYITEKEEDEYCLGHDCEECWNREIPETIKENKEKETNMRPTENMTNEEIIKAKNDEIEKLKKEVQDLERYKRYSKMADEIAAIRKSFIDAGFSKDEAFALTHEFVKNGMAMVMRNMR